MVNSIPIHTLFHVNRKIKTPKCTLHLTHYRHGKCKTIYNYRLFL